MGPNFDFTEKPPIGGWLPGVEFTGMQAKVIDAIADAMIPAGDGFPAPSTVNIVGYFSRYVTPQTKQAKWFPFFSEINFKLWLDALGESFVESPIENQIKVLKDIEKSDPGFFARLRDSIYLGYYSRPETIRAINVNLPAGRDYKTSPQPFGYSENMLDWNPALLGRVRGNYLRTEDVKPVNTRGLGL